jgi:hypothetical protein
LIAAAGDGSRDARGAAALVGKYLHHAADGVGAVQRGQRAVHDVNVVDVRQWQGGPVGGARRRRANADAVDQHHALLGVGAADEYGRRGARAAISHHLDAALLLQQVDEVRRAGAHDVGS